MTFDELLQQHHVVEPETPKKRPFTRALALGAVYKIYCPDGLADHVHGSYIRIIGIGETSIRYEYLTPAERQGETNSFTPDSYFAECLRFAYRNLQEYTTCLAV